MKYAITYSKTFRYMKDVDEIILYWSDEDDIVDFVTEKFEQKQRIIVDFEDYGEEDLEEAIPVLIKLKEAHPNFSIKIDIPTHEDYIDTLKEEGIPFFISTFCDNWDTVYAYVKLGVSDIYIFGALCFELKNIKHFCEFYKVKVRVLPNIAQSSEEDFPDMIPDICKFFIRPEDISTYEEFVDICELWCPLESQSVLYEIYKNEQWLGNLNDIISYFHIRVPNTGIMPYFAKARINCKKKCLKGKKCQICESALTLAQMMLEDGVEVITQRKTAADTERLLKELNNAKERMEQEEQEEGIEE